MKLIAISGWKQSGKDTSAEFLIKNHNFKRVAFADSLKDLVSKQYNVLRSAMDDPALKESPLLHYPVLPKDNYSLHIAKFMFGEFRDVKGRKVHDYHIDASGAFLGVLGKEVVQLYWTPRALCILEGSIKRTVDSSYWLDQAIASMKYNQHTRFVISDLRYKSEIETLKQTFNKDLITIRVNRFETPPSNDPSERDLDNYKFDYYIDNKTTLEDLYNAVEYIVKTTC